MTSRRLASDSSNPSGVLYLQRRAVLSHGSSYLRKLHRGRGQECMLVIPAMGRLGQGHLEFKACLNYMVRLYIMNAKPE